MYVYKFLRATRWLFVFGSWDLLMITFTSLHRLLGQMPGPVTDEMVDLAVTEGLAETTDLDWKSKLPDIKGLSQHDFPKDVAAMANSGGGVIVFGIEEKDKKATGRVDIGVLTEQHERALRSVAVSAISPPIMGLDIQRVGDEGDQVVVVAIPPTIDGPHLIYKENYFGAPIRNDADTVWMKGRQIETMYRARFEEQRHATESLDNVYEEALQGRDTQKHAWFVAVALPRFPAMRTARPTQEEARASFEEGASFGRLNGLDGGHPHPLANVPFHTLRAGLRRWKAVNVRGFSGGNAWRETEAALHHDGSVSLATAIGGYPVGWESFDPGGTIRTKSIEIALTDFMGLVRAASKQTGSSEYEIRIGIESESGAGLVIKTTDAWGMQLDAPFEIPRFTPVTATIQADASREDYREQLRGLAEDCINQCGALHLTIIREDDHSA